MTKREFFQWINDGRFSTLFHIGQDKFLLKNLKLISLVDLKNTKQLKLVTTKYNITHDLNDSFLIGTISDEQKIIQQIKLKSLIYNRDFNVNLLCVHYLKDRKKTMIIYVETNNMSEYNIEKYIVEGKKINEKTRFEIMDI